MESESEKPRHGIQSIEVGGRLLRVLAANSRPMMLRDLARNAAMPAAKAHRYLVSFVRMGLVEQDANTGRYDLGAFAMELGLASLARIDAVKLAAPVLEDLYEQIGETVALAMWANRGPTCVRWIEADGPITITLRTGVVLPLTTSATGRAFAAFYRSPSMKKQLDKELRAAAESEGCSPAEKQQAMECLLGEIRQHGIARADGSLTPGINGFSAPVFDHSGKMVAAITSLGPVGNFDNRWESSLAARIKAAAALLSSRLGFDTAAGKADDIPAEDPRVRRVRRSPAQPRKRAEKSPQEQTS
ncbi:IclR family transcriptional regulator [Rhodocyclus tenuis]|uniref:Helix-turn-helix domain-containing protein n=2 Tax=Rhodocyclus TaxID=1064 RepID=A0A6L5JW18_RHOTE|nr:IclR family transcriptional regulator [Rhodocyclus gracilis]MQY51555.1 helix-turn-helix domain-containing protein [Rhodocyclus gracilis]MRD73037.1 helix-turn-helix domain-containing protein [Rhodocyclus gracilis]NJA89185.1 IclR family transcriptional regulator [Rhodocyclus gracilis]